MRTLPRRMPAQEESTASVRDQRPRWYACYTRGRHEKRVDDLLRERRIEAFLPLGRFSRQWKDRRQTLQLPLFPGYLFARFAEAELASILRVPGVVTVVRHSGRLAPVPDADIENVRHFASMLGIVEDPSFSPQGMVEGTRVRIRSGPFRDVEGVIVQIRGSARVLVGVQTIGMGFPVDVDISAVEVLPARGAQPSPISQETQ